MAKSATYTLSLETRNTDTKLSEIRRGDADKKAQIPGVIYGKKTESQTFTVDYSEFLKTYRDAGKSNIIAVTLGKDEHDVLVQDVQLHPVTGKMQHVDLNVLVRGEKVHTKIPLHMIGEAPAAREGALIDQSLHELDVKCLPRDLVDHFDVDISVLNETGDIIHISDLGLDLEKYEVHIDLSTAVASAQAVRSQKIEDDPAEVTEEAEGAEEGSEEAAE